jgi:hypothetical protein
MTDAAATLVDRYLNELCWAMGGTFAEQQAVRDELFAHIAEAAREARLAGDSPIDAARSALLELGEPRSLGAGLRSARGVAVRSRPLMQPAGAILIEPHRERHLPNPALLLALTASVATALAVALAFAWPG